MSARGRETLTDQLVMTNERLTMVDMALMGKSPGQIARELGKTKSYVLTTLDDALADAHTLLIEKTERLHLIQLIRMERLVAAGMPYALGMVDPNTGLPTKKDGSAVTEQLRPPDRAWVREMANMTKLIMEWEDRLYERRAKMPENLPEALRQTMTGADEMYEIARSEIQADWVSEHADLQAIDLIPPRTTEEDVTRAAAIEPELEFRKEKLEKTARRLLDRGADAFLEELDKLEDEDDDNGD